MCLKSVLCSALFSFTSELDVFDVMCVKTELAHALLCLLLFVVVAGRQTNAYVASDWYWSTSCDVKWVTSDKENFLGLDHLSDFYQSSQK
jgi:hypothetical protein